jgi:hypothetical protein
LIKSAFTPNIADRHWNLVGNPYPSAIDANKFLTQNSTIEGSVYIWDSSSATFNNTNPAPFYENSIVNYSDAYITYNSMGSVPANAFDGNIAAGQGFFVKVLDAVPGGTAQFRNTMRYGAGETVIPNDDFLRGANNTNDAAETAEKQLMWLFLSNETNQSSSTLVGYAVEATNGKDRLYDAFANKGEGELSLHSVLEDNNMVIQGRALPFDTDDTVSMGVQIPEVGVYEIGIDKIEGSIVTDVNLSILLEDTYLNVTQDLKLAPYTFTADATGTINDRFVLRFTAAQLSIKDANIPETFAFVKSGNLTVQSATTIEKVQVFDLTGKMIMDLTPKQSANRLESGFNFARGAYITVITLEGNITTSIKLIN